MTIIYQLKNTKSGKKLILTDCPGRGAPHKSDREDSRGPVPLKAWLNQKTLLRRQKFPTLAARETYVAETNFAARKEENVFALSQKHSCFLDTNFASATYVSQFSHPKKHDPQQCFLV